MPFVPAVPPPAAPLASPVRPVALAGTTPTALRQAYAHTHRLLNAQRLWVDWDGPAWAQALPSWGVLHPLNEALQTTAANAGLWDALRPSLLVADRMALQALTQARLVDATPQLWLSTQGKAAETAILPGLQGHTTIFSAMDPTLPLRQAVPAPPQLDGVLLRWLVLYHEAAHTQRGQIEDPIYLEDAPEVSTALNAFIWECGGFTGAPRDVFEETFADVYGALALLRLTGNTPAARQTVAYLRAIRLHEQAEAAQRVGGWQEGHGAGDALGWVLAHTAEASGTAWLMQSPPDALQRQAQGQASRVLVAWWQTHSQDAAWLAFAQMEPHAERVEALAQMRVSDYLSARVMAYAAAPDDPALLAHSAARQAGGSPLLQQLAAEDVAIRASFLAAVPAQTVQQLERFTRIHVPPASQLTPGGENPLSSDPAYTAWLERESTALVTAHPELLVAEQARLQALADTVQASLVPESLVAEEPVVRRRPKF